MLTIHAAIIHRIEKEAHGHSVLRTREKPLALGGPVVELVNQLARAYRDRSGKGYGRFMADETTYPTSKILRSALQDGSSSFYDASLQLMAVLKSRADAVPLATGGFMLMTHFSNEAQTQWFLAAMITNVAGTAINDQLEVVDAKHIDVRDLRVAGRVNLTEWWSGDANLKYIGFLKHRGEVADYFKSFLGCDDLFVPNEETKKLVNAIRDFSRAQKLRPEAREVLMQQAHDYCRERAKNNEPLILEDLSNHLWPTEPRVLQAAMADHGITDGFVPHTPSLKGFVKIRAKSVYWRLEVDREAFTHGGAKYDARRRTLTLLDLPDEFVDELVGELGNG